MAEQVFKDRYQMVRHVARGGMAEVYLAHDRLLDRPVALKVLFPEFAANRSFVERFRREARAAANLNHPNIVAVYDWGEEGHTYFIVMEFLEGQTLRECILSNRRLAAPQAAELGAEMAGALAFAHRNGVIHRDVKPGNVIISPTGTVKVADFGIARAGDPQENLTQTGAVMGTATYFSPEQAQGRPLDHRTDIYSLGVVLYEMVSGKPPFTGESPVAIAYQHVREPPPPLSQERPPVPPAFEAVVMKAMAKDPENRYESAEDLRADLLRFRAGRPVAAAATAPLAAAGDATVVSATRVGTVVEDGTTVLPAAAAAAVVARPRRRAGAYIGVLAVLLVALGLLLFLLYRALGAGEGTPQVLVPTVVGLPRADAESRLRAAGLEPDVRQESNDTAAADIVFDQDPKPPAKVDRKGAVVLKVSQGPPPGTVPDVTGLTFDQASKSLQQAGFRAAKRNVYDPAPANEVLDQRPRAGDKQPKDATITLTVSRGPQPTTIPATTPPTSPPQTQPPFTQPPPEPPPTTFRTTRTTSPDQAP